jgi:TRAP-type C4-dicarboxylate transport system permease small subunit
MEAFTKVKKIVDVIMNWFCIALLMVMTVLVTYQVITRYFFNKPSAISEITAQYMFVWMVMFGSALVFGERGHLEITAIKDKLKPTAYMIVEILSNITLIAFSLGVCIIGGWNIAMQQMGTLDAALQISMGLIYISIPVCGLFMVFYAIYNMCLAVKERKDNIRTAQDSTAGTM